MNPVPQPEGPSKALYMSRQGGRSYRSSVRWREGGVHGLATVLATRLITPGNLVDAGGTRRVPSDTGKSRAGVLQGCGGLSDARGCIHRERMKWGLGGHGGRDRFSASAKTGSRRRIGPSGTGSTQGAAADTHNAMGGRHRRARSSVPARRERGEAPGAAPQRSGESYSEGVRCSRRHVALQRQARSSPTGSPRAAGLQKLARGEGLRAGVERSNSVRRTRERGRLRTRTLLAILIPPTRPSKILAAQSMVQAQPETTEWSDGLRSEQR